VLTALGVVFGFPLLTSIAMRHVSAVHASVIVGVLPLATAAVGALLHRQRPSPAFWACAALGTGLVVGFAVLRRAPPGWRCTRPICCCWAPCCARPWAMVLARGCRSTCGPSS
jgi:drug/metabolite transporter (DMT)-like permease